jgi:hypothetical protein
VFVVRTADGGEVKGALRGLGADWSVRVGEGTRVPGEAVVSVRRADLTRPPLPTDDHLVLVNGDRIPVHGVRLAGERLHFRHPDLAGGKETSLPLTAVLVYWRGPPDKVADAEGFRRRLVTGTRSRDLVWLRNGDTLEGVVNGLDEREIEVEVGRKAVTTKLNQVAAVALSTELADALKPRGVFARLVLTDTEQAQGGRLSLTSAGCGDGATLRGTTVFGARLSVPLERVAALDPFQGAAVYLSDLKPKGYEYRPFLDEDWPWAADGNAAGHDLRLGGVSYDKGVGLHGPCRLTYRVPGGCRRFEALVGLDDQDGRGGSASVRVLGDGKELDIGPGRVLAPGGGPLRVAVKVEGVKELTLEVGLGANGNVRGVVNWADARLVK